MDDKTLFCEFHKAILKLREHTNRRREKLGVPAETGVGHLVDNHLLGAIMSAAHDGRPFDLVALGLAADLPRSTVARHVKKMADQGLVRMEPSSQRTLLFPGPRITDETYHLLANVVREYCPQIVEDFDQHGSPNQLSERAKPHGDFTV